MSRTVYANPDPETIHNLESVSDDDKDLYIVMLENQSPIVHEQFIKHSRNGRIGIVVGFIDPQTGTPMVGWSIASKDDRERMRKGNAAFSNEEYNKLDNDRKTALRQIARLEYAKLFKLRAKFIAYKRAIPAAEYITQDRTALCQKCPTKAVPIVAKMVGTIVGEWAQRLPHCHCPGRDDEPEPRAKQKDKRQMRKEQMLSRVTNILRKLAG